MVDTDRVTGAAKEFVGKAQGAAGDFTGSKNDSVEGRFREAQGSAENLYGKPRTPSGASPTRPAITPRTPTSMPATTPAGAPAPWPSRSRKAPSSRC
jgi:uncharacterized protein YjbJ (UPF0337 family)